MRMLFNLLKTLNFSTSRNYWKERYRHGGTSGEGSYGQLAAFKADTINRLVHELGVNKIVELGCGDGNQASQFDVPGYLGLDISEEAVELARNRNKDKPEFEFYVYDPDRFENHLNEWRSDMALSLDVIFHLVEDETYDTYLEHLFRLARQWILIYSSNHNDKRWLRLRHVRHRHFTRDIALRFPDWELINTINNPLAVKPAGYSMTGSHAHFFLYRKNI